MKFSVQERKGSNKRSGVVVVSHVKTPCNRTEEFFLLLLLLQRTFSSFSEDKISCFVVGAEEEEE
jgi:hypothetical protein